MWEDGDFGGDKWVNWRPTANNQKYQIDGWDGDNEISSIINNTRYDVALYDNDNYDGEDRCLRAGRQVEDLDSGWDFNDRIESAKPAADRASRPTGCPS